MPRGVGARQASDKFDQGIANTDACFAACAAAAKKEVRKQRNIFAGSNGPFAMRATRARHGKVVALPWRQGFAPQLGGLRMPIALHDLRQAVYHHVEEAANRETDKKTKPGEIPGLCKEVHSESYFSGKPPRGGCRFFTRRSRV